MNRYSRQVRFAPLGEEGQAKIRTSRVVLVGAGALGSFLAGHLVRAGVGALRLCDRDFVELDNLHRQALYDEDDVRANLPKATAAARKLERANSEVSIDPRVCDVNFSNVEDLVRDADLVLDGTDNFETRFVLNDACVKLGRPWVYGGCVGSRGTVMAVLPGAGPCLSCVAGAAPAPGTVPTCDVAGVLNAAVGVVASLQAAEALKILSGRYEALAGGLVEVDVWENTHRVLRVPRSLACETCGARKFRYLEKPASSAVSLCGRGAVQILPSSGEVRLDLEDMERKLASLGEVTRNAFLLKFRTGPYELTLFPDARAIIRGTEDAAQARSLYARYVGA